MKKYLGVLGLVLILCAAVPVMAFAEISAEDLYTVDSNGSTTPKSVFGPDETPWLYMHLSGLDSGVQSVGASWWIDSESNAHFEGTNPSTSSEYWFSPSNWDTIIKTGAWTINAAYYASDSKFDMGQTSFTVTPEPLSVSLFLLGAGALALRRRKIVR